MDFLAHRGFWNETGEKNTLKAFEKAFMNGLGVETDIRDNNGQLVISHNIPAEGALPLEELFKLYRNLGCTDYMALNVKADGIQDKLHLLLKKYQIDNYFLFDMSVPEQVVIHNMNLKYYTRQSDIESQCVLYESADGVWLDSFFEDAWLTPDIIRKHLNKGKMVCIVSPELHGRNPLKIWEMIRDAKIENHRKLQLCTDIPNNAKEFFYGQDKSSFI